jgi:hypothetical protein
MDGDNKPRIEPNNTPKLFAPDAEDSSNAYLHPNKLEEWSLHACGYKYAADLAIEHYLDDNKPFLDPKEHSIPFQKADILLFPVLFLYRHYIELRLKNIIVNGSILEYVLENSVYPTKADDILLKEYSHHFIFYNNKYERIDNSLWSKARKILENFNKDSEEFNEYLIILDRLEEYIKQISELDPDSTASRYPVIKIKLGNDKVLKPAFYQTSHRLIGLERLHKYMRELYGFLEKECLTLDCYLDAQKYYIGLCLEAREAFGYYSEDL